MFQNEVIHTWPVVFAAVLQVFLVAFLASLIHTWPIFFVHCARVSRYIILVALLCFYLLGYSAYGLTVALLETPYCLVIELFMYDDIHDNVFTYHSRTLPALCLGTSV